MSRTWSRRIVGIDVAQIKKGMPGSVSFPSIPGAQGELVKNYHTAEAVSSCRASRFRATCSRRLIVPIGASNDALICDERLAADVERFERVPIELAQPRQAAADLGGPLVGQHRIERRARLDARGIERLRLGRDRSAPGGPAG